MINAGKEKRAYTLKELLEASRSPSTLSGKIQKLHIAKLPEEERPVRLQMSMLPASYCRNHR